MGTGPKQGRAGGLIIIKGAGGDAGSTAATLALSSAYMRRGRHAPRPFPSPRLALADPARPSTSPS